VALKIPTHPTFGSLNLASEVQLIAYEWQLICAAPESLAASTLGPGFAKQSTLADGQQISGLLRHWEEMLTHTKYLDPEQPMKLLPRLQQIFNRAQLRDEEVNLLRGIARSVLQSTPQKKRE
jgi:tRNA/rRNA methyltransferase